MQTDRKSGTRRIRPSSWYPLRYWHLKSLHASLYSTSFFYMPQKAHMNKLHKSYNSGFPFGFLKERPELVKGIPLAVTSAAAGALGAFMTKKGCLAQKIGLSMVLGGAISNLYDRLVKGYVVDYFSIEFKRLKKVIFNLGDIFVFLGSLVFLIGELLEDIDLKN